MCTYDYVCSSFVSYPDPKQDLILDLGTRLVVHVHRYVYVYISNNCKYVIIRTPFTVHNNNCNNNHT